jgi:hypothetical protein
VSETRLINRRQVKAFALSLAAKRAHKFSRVSGDFLLRCEANLKWFVRQHVERLPSRGKTIT